MEKTINLKVNNPEAIASLLVSDMLRMNLNLDNKAANTLAWYTAITVRNEITMYTGNLNPKWALWDDVVKVLKERTLD